MSCSSASQGISWKEHIRNRNDFKEIFRRAKRIDKKGLRIYYTRNNKGTSRFAIVVGKKIGCAVTRNRIKRVIREVYRRNKGFFEGGVDWIFVPKGQWDTIRYKDIEKLVIGAVIEFDKGRHFSKKGIMQRKE